MADQSYQCALPKYQQCCCTCQFRLNDWSHPDTDGKRMSNLRGYICANPELGHYSGWGPHGLCECWGKREKQPASDNIGREDWDNLYGERTRSAQSEKVNPT